MTTDAYVPKYRRICKKIAQKVHKILEEEIDEVLLNWTDEDHGDIVKLTDDATYYLLGRKARDNPDEIDGLDDDPEWYEAKARIYRIVHQIMEGD